jgi:hypothetical protein
LQKTGIGKTLSGIAGGSKEEKLEGEEEEESRKIKEVC